MKALLLGLALLAVAASLPAHSNKRSNGVTNFKLGRPVAHKPRVYSIKLVKIGIHKKSPVLNRHLTKKEKIIMKKRYNKFVRDMKIMMLYRYLQRRMYLRMHGPLHRRMHHMYLLGIINRKNYFQHLKNISKEYAFKKRAFWKRNRKIINCKKIAFRKYKNEIKAYKKKVKKAAYKLRKIKAHKKAVYKIHKIKSHKKAVNKIHKKSAYKKAMYDIAVDEIAACKKAAYKEYAYTITAYMIRAYKKAIYKKTYYKIAAYKRAVDKNSAYNKAMYNIAVYKKGSYKKNVKKVVIKSKSKKTLRVKSKKPKRRFIIKIRTIILKPFYKRKIKHHKPSKGKQNKKKAGKTAKKRKSSRGSSKNHKKPSKSRRDPKKR